MNDTINNTIYTSWISSEKIRLNKEKIKKQKKLKPCPFCGHSAGVGQGLDGYFINCTWCSASTDILTGHNNTEQEAIDLWNRRVGDV